MCPNFVRIEMGVTSAAATRKERMRQDHILAIEWVTVAVISSKTDTR